MILSAVLSLLCLLAVGTTAQQTGSTYTDTNTGITFQRYVNGNYTFGVAVPENITTDFIGQFSVASTVGWAGAALAGTMLNSLLIVTYPNGDSVLSSIRQADDYQNPHLANNTRATINPIAQGTFVNSTGWTITFLCSNCITTDGRTFFSNATNPYLGWTQSTTPLQNTSDPDAVLNFHKFYGSWGVNLTAAQSPYFESWASLATPSNGSTTTNATDITKSAESRLLRRGTHAFTRNLSL